MRTTRCAAIVVISLSGIALSSSAAFGDELRFRFVNPRGSDADVIETPYGYASAAPNRRARVRLQIGVFDSESGPELAGGVIGWNVGSISVSGFFTEPMPVIRTPGRLNPFRFSASPNANGTPTTDPFTAITQIDCTLGTQNIPWPIGSDPETPPPPIVRGLNTFVSIYEVSMTLPEFAIKELRTLTIQGNLIAATGWTIVQAIPPTEDEPGVAVYAPHVVPSTPFAVQQSILVYRLWTCPVDFDDNFRVNSQDFFEFINAFFGRDPLADMNLDGVVNSQDFFVFLEEFFAGCP